MCCMETVPSAREAAGCLCLRVREARDGTRPSGNGNRQKNGFCILEGMVWQGPVVFNAGSKSLQTFSGCRGYNCHSGV